MPKTPKKPAVLTGPHPGGGWQNKVEGNKRASNVAPTKAQAQAQAKGGSSTRATRCAWTSATASSSSRRPRLLSRRLPDATPGEADGSPHRR